MVRQDDLENAIRPVDVRNAEHSSHMPNFTRNEGRLYNSCGLDYFGSRAQIRHDFNPAHVVNQ
jgi:hypothetical protein